MGRHTHQIALTIPLGETEASLTDANSARIFRQAERVAVYPPTTLPETVTLEVAPVESPVAADWTTVGLVDVVAQVAGHLVPFRALKLTAGVGVAADRVFRIECVIGCGC